MCDTGSYVPLLTLMTEISVVVLQVPDDHHGTRRSRSQLFRSSTR